jgi:hypothetical protein
MDLNAKREVLRAECLVAWELGAPDAERRAKLAVREFPSLANDFAVRWLLGCRTPGYFGLGSRRWD